MLCGTFRCTLPDSYAGLHRVLAPTRARERRPTAKARDDSSSDDEEQPAAVVRVTASCTRRMKVSAPPARMAGGDCKRRKCEHGRLRTVCKECGGGTICMQARQAANRMQGVRRRRHMRAWQAALRMQRVRRPRLMQARQGAQPMQRNAAAAAYASTAGGAAFAKSAAAQAYVSMAGCAAYARSVAASAYVSTASNAADARIAKPTLCLRCLRMMDCLTFWMLCRTSLK
jgi:hypothetical protein